MDSPLSQAYGDRFPSIRYYDISGLSGFPGVKAPLSVCGVVAGACLPEAKRARELAAPASIADDRDEPGVAVVRAPFPHRSRWPSARPASPSLARRPTLRSRRVPRPTPPVVAPAPHGRSWLPAVKHNRPQARPPGVGPARLPGRRSAHQERALRPLGPAMGLERIPALGGHPRCRAEPPAPRAAAAPIPTCGWDLKRRVRYRAPLDGNRG